MERFREYFRVIGYTITGLVFGLSFFLLLLNLYHYQEMSYKYVKQDSDSMMYDSMKSKLKQIDDIANSFDSNQYKGMEDVASLNRIKSKLSICVDKIDTNEFKSFVNKKEILIKDVYDMQQFYQGNIANECLVKQLYDLTNHEDSNLNISTINTMAPFFSDQINYLTKSTDYIQKVVKGNSSYYFASENSKVTLYDQTKDSYYALLNNYHDAIDFIYDVSLWYQEIIGG